MLRLFATCFNISINSVGYRPFFKVLNIRNSIKMVIKELLEHIYVHIKNTLYVVLNQNNYLILSLSVKMIVLELQ